MKRILSVALILVLTVVLCGCNQTDKSQNNSSPFKITMPADDSVNGYRIKSDKNISKTTASAKDEKPEIIKYYANIKTKKFHLHDCAYAENASADNIYITLDRGELLNMGYSPCKRCNP